jgi:hypothetical protein
MLADAGLVPRTGCFPCFMRKGIDAESNRLGHDLANL